MSEFSRVDRLIADRDRLESAIAKAAPRELAPLVREHRAVLKEISQLGEPAKGTIRDQLAAKRAARGAEAAGATASEA